MRYSEIPPSGTVVYVYVDNLKDFESIDKIDTRAVTVEREGEPYFLWLCRGSDRYNTSLCPVNLEKLPLFKSQKAAIEYALDAAMDVHNQQEKYLHDAYAALHPYDVDHLTSCN